jgi:hypothetical protein
MADAASCAVRLPLNESGAMMILKSDFRYSKVTSIDLSFLLRVTFFVFPPEVIT